MDFLSRIVTRLEFSYACLIIDIDTRVVSITEKQFLLPRYKWSFYGSFRSNSTTSKPAINNPAATTRLVTKVTFEFTAGDK